MSLINTNQNYLKTMGIAEEDPQVGIIVSVYYLGCAVGAVIFSKIVRYSIAALYACRLNANTLQADTYGRKPALFGCLAMASLGNAIMFVAGLGYGGGKLPWPLLVMYLGRIIMGLGVGGVDSVVPVYSSELASDDSRGKALAQEFQSNIFGLNMAFAINLAITVALGKTNEWAWRVPIIAMQVYPIGLLIFIERLPESPRWLISHERDEDAKKALDYIMGEDDAGAKFDEMSESNKAESDENVSYVDMFTPSHAQFHPTMITVMGQVCQALTGYGGKSSLRHAMNDVIWIAVLRLCVATLSPLLTSHCSCFRIWATDLRVTWLRYQDVGVPYPGELHIVLRSNDFRLVTNRCARTPLTNALGLFRPDNLLLTPNNVRWPG